MYRRECGCGPVVLECNIFACILVGPVLVLPEVISLGQHGSSQRMHPGAISIGSWARSCQIFIGPREVHQGSKLINV